MEYLPSIVYSSYRDLFFWDLLGFFNKFHITPLEGEGESLVRVRARASGWGQE
jgi:hypothetical protein